MRYLEVDEEVEKLESVIADIESAISEIKCCPYFEHKVSLWEEELSELNERLAELETIQNNVWKSENRQRDIEFEGGRL